MAVGTSKVGTLGLLTVFASASFAHTQSAFASKCDDEQKRAEAVPAVPKVTKDARGRSVFFIEKPVVVCGITPKPKVVYVLQASKIDYQWEPLKKNFLPKVSSAVSKAPF